MAVSRRARPRRMASSRRFFLAISLLVAASAHGCAGAGEDRPAELKKTNVFASFKKVTSIRLDVNTADGKEILWYVPEAKWREFESIFDRGVPYRNAQKRVVYALITITADRNEVVWSVLHMSNGECMLEISQDECWRGIKLRDIVRFVEGCEPRGTAP
jgi:hypothetical protein